MKKFYFLFIIPLLLSAQNEYLTPAQIEVQLDQAEAQFNRALKMFNPWYTGPLITPGPSMTPQGEVVPQPYVFFTDNYALFNKERKSVDTPNEFQIQTPTTVQFGITPSVDATIGFGAQGSWKGGKSGGGFQDMSFALGFLILNQTRYVPKGKFSISQSFPTGSYKNLDKDGLLLDGVGAGAYQTSFTLAFGKLLFWDTQHPFNTRVAFSYKVSTPIHVTNFNSYGGGLGTKGTVHPGNQFNADLGLELSINQPWVAALDVVYTCTNRTKFHGTTSAPVGGGYSDQLSLAPAIEYNFNDSMGILFGAQFSVYGRNSANFASGIISWYGEFP